MIASGVMRGKLRAKFFVVLDLVRLADLQSQLQRSLLHRRKRKLHAPALGPVRLGHHQAHREASLHQLFQSGHGERRRAAENEMWKKQGIENSGIRIRVI